MADNRMVVIRHPQTGQEGAILPADFTRANLHPKGVGSYADQGWTIDRYESGESYDGPKSKREIERAEQERQAKREAAAKPKPAPKAEPKDRP